MRWVLVMLFIVVAIGVWANGGKKLGRSITDATSQPVPPEKAAQHSTITVPAKPFCEPSKDDDCKAPVNSGAGSSSGTDASVQTELRFGDLHEWRTTLPSKRLATADDMLVRVRDEPNIQPFDLMTCIDEVSADAANDNRKVAETAALCMAMLHR